MEHACNYCHGPHSNGDHPGWKPTADPVMLQPAEYVAIVKVTGKSYREVVERLQDLAWDLTDGQDATVRERIGSHHIAVISPAAGAPTVDWREGARG